MRSAGASRAPGWSSCYMACSCRRRHSALPLGNQLRRGRGTCPTPPRAGPDRKPGPGGSTDDNEDIGSSAGGEPAGPPAPAPQQQQQQPSTSSGSSSEGGSSRQDSDGWDDDRPPLAAAGALLGLLLAAAAAALVAVLALDIGSLLPGTPLPPSPVPPPPVVAPVGGIRSAVEAMEKVIAAKPGAAPAPSKPVRLPTASI